MQLRLALDSKRQAREASSQPPHPTKTRLRGGENKSRIRIRKNPEPIEVEAGVEHQRGWAPASRGARLSAFITSAPPHGDTLNPKPQTLTEKTEVLNPKPRTYASSSVALAMNLRKSWPAAASGPEEVWWNSTVSNKPGLSSACCVFSYCRGPSN